MIKEHEVDVLWETVAILNKEKHSENAVALFKHLVKQTFKAAMNISAKFVENITLDLSSDQDLKKVQKLDKKIHDSLPKKDDDFYGLVLDYLEAISKLSSHSFREIHVSFFKEIDSIPEKRASIYKEMFYKELASMYKEMASIPLEKEIDYHGTYSTLEVAEIMGVSDQTIRRWCEKGKFSGATKTKGGHWRIPRKYFKITPEQARRRKEFDKRLNEFNQMIGEVSEDEFL